MNDIQLGKARPVHRLNMDEKRLLLSLGWLSLCPPSFGEAVLSRLRIRLLKEGETLYHPRDPSEGLVAVVSGALAVSVVVPEFGPTISHVMLPGAWFGEAAITGQPRTIGVHATRPSRVGILAMPDVRAIVTEHPDAWTEFTRLAILNGQLAIGAGYDMMMLDPRRRCAATLLRLAGLRHMPPLSGAPVEIDITQADLAHMACMSRNTAARILKELRESGCIALGYGNMSVLNPSALLRILSAEP